MTPKPGPGFEKLCYRLRQRWGLSCRGLIRSLLFSSLLFSIFKLVLFQPQQTLTKVTSVEAIFWPPRDCVLKLRSSPLIQPHSLDTFICSLRVFGNEMCKQEQICDAAVHCCFPSGGFVSTFTPLAALLHFFQADVTGWKFAAYQQ